MLDRLICETGNFCLCKSARIHSWGQPVLNNEGKISYLRKQKELLMGLELTNGRHPLITSQTRYPLWF